MFHDLVCLYHPELSFPRTPNPLSTLPTPRNPIPWIPNVKYNSKLQPPPPVLIVEQAVSEPREIIRPKKKKVDRFEKLPARKAAPPPPRRTTNRAQPPPTTALESIEERSGVFSTPPSSAAPRAVSEVVVVKKPDHTVPPPNSEEEEEEEEGPDPRSLAAEALLKNNRKGVTFSERVRVNTAESEPLLPRPPCDSVSNVYVPVSLTAQVPSFDPERAAEISDTALSVDCEAQADAVEFLVGYVTSYQTNTGDGRMLEVPPPRVTSPAPARPGYSNRTYRHAIEGLSESLNSVRDSENNDDDIQGGVPVVVVEDTSALSAGTVCEATLGSCEATSESPLGGCEAPTVSEADGAADPNAPNTVPHPNSPPSTADLPQLTTSSDLTSSSALISSSDDITSDVTHDVISSHDVTSGNDITMATSNNTAALLGPVEEGEDEEIAAVYSLSDILLETR
eukprot:sb/3464612/